MHNKDIAPALLYNSDCELIIFVSDSELKLYVSQFCLCKTILGESKVQIPCRITQESVHIHYTCLKHGKKSFQSKNFFFRIMNLPFFHASCRFSELCRLSGKNGRPLRSEIGIIWKLWKWDIPCTPRFNDILRIMREMTLLSV